MHRLITFVTATFCLLTSSCTNLSDRKRETPLLITTIDINEAEYVRECLKRSGAAHYQVLAGQTTTEAYLKMTLAKEDEASVRDTMRSMKAEMTNMRGRIANTLVFKFRNTTLRE
jgi:hypothetical protein